MNDGVLDHLILGYGAVFDAKRQPGITRLTLHPTSSAAAPDVPGLQEVLAQAWQPSHGMLALNLTSESWLRALLDSLTENGPAPQWQVEVPAFVLTDAALSNQVVELAARSQPFVLKGRPLSPLSPTLMRSFQYAIIEIDEERRVPGAAPAGAPPRTLAFVQAGAQTGADAAAAFGRGAVGVLGWPLGDPPEPGRRGKSLPASVRVVMDLMQRLDREEPVGQLEAVLRSDPALGYRLMRYINSPGFGLSVEVNSFSHAIMILGYSRLKRWLALLMTGAVDSPDMRPLMFLAVRRGLLMEELARGLADEALRNEAFICGVFSLLDRMLDQPFEELLRSVPVPERVAHALADHTGELAPSLALATAIESGLPLDIQQADEAMMLSPGEANRAALLALAASRQLQTD
jgi:c-di-GMP phosphodiesterase